MCKPGGAWIVLTRDEVYDSVCAMLDATVDSETLMLCSALLKECANAELNTGDAKKVEKWVNPDMAVTALKMGVACRWPESVLNDLIDVVAAH